MDPDFIRELFAPFRPVTLRRMFSGAGISVEGVTFALLLRGALYLRADQTSIAAFEAEGSQPFSYTRTRDGKQVVVGSYWRIPERLYDDPDELAIWAERAFGIALQSKAKPRTRRAKRAAKPAAKKPAAKKRARRARRKRPMLRR